MPRDLLRNKSKSKNINSSQREEGGEHMRVDQRIARGFCSSLSLPFGFSFKPRIAALILIGIACALLCTLYYLSPPSPTPSTLKRGEGWSGKNHRRHIGNDNKNDGLLDSIIHSAFVKSRGNASSSSHSTTQQTRLHQKLLINEDGDYNDYDPRFAELTRELHSNNNENNRILANEEATTNNASGLLHFLINNSDEHEKRRKGRTNEKKNIAKATEKKGLLFVRWEGTHCTDGAWLDHNKFLTAERCGHLSFYKRYLQGLPIIVGSDRAAASQAAGAWLHNHRKSSGNNDVQTKKANGNVSVSNMEPRDSNKLPERLCFNLLRAKLLMGTSGTQNYNPNVLPPCAEFTLGTFRLDAIKNSNTCNSSAMSASTATIAAAAPAAALSTAPSSPSSSPSLTTSKSKREALRAVWRRIVIEEGRQLFKMDAEEEGEEKEEDAVVGKNNRHVTRQHLDANERREGSSSSLLGRMLRRLRRDERFTEAIRPSDVKFVRYGGYFERRKGNRNRTNIDSSFSSIAEEGEKSTTMIIGGEDDKGFIVPPLENAPSTFPYRLQVRRRWGRQQHQQEEGEEKALPQQTEGVEMRMMGSSPRQQPRRGDKTTTMWENLKYFSPAEGLAILHRLAYSHQPAELWRGDNDGGEEEVKKTKRNETKSAEIKVEAPATPRPNPHNLPEFLLERDGKGEGGEENRRRGKGILFTGDSIVRQLFLNIVTHLRGQPITAEYYHHDDGLYVAYPDSDVLISLSKVNKIRYCGILSQWFPGYTFPRKVRTSSRRTVPFVCPPYQEEEDEDEEENDSEAMKGAEGGLRQQQQNASPNLKKLSPRPLFVMLFMWDPTPSTPRTDAFAIAPHRVAVHLSAYVFWWYNTRNGKQLFGGPIGVPGSAMGVSINPHLSQITMSMNSFGGNPPLSYQSSSTPSASSSTPSPPSAASEEEGNGEDRVEKSNKSRAIDDNNDHDDDAFISTASSSSAAGGGSGASIDRYKHIWLTTPIITSAIDSNAVIGPIAIRNAKMRRWVKHGILYDDIPLKVMEVVYGSGDEGVIGGGGGNEKNERGNEGKKTKDEGRKTKNIVSNRNIRAIIDRTHDPDEWLGREPFSKYSFPLTTSPPPGGEEVNKSHQRDKSTAPLTGGGGGGESVLYYLDEFGEYRRINFFVEDIPRATATDDGDDESDGGLDGGQRMNGGVDDEHPPFILRKEAAEIRKNSAKVIIPASVASGSGSSSITAANGNDTDRHRHSLKYISHLIFNANDNAENSFSTDAGRGRSSNDSLIVVPSPQSPPKPIDLASIVIMRPANDAGGGEKKTGGNKKKRGARRRRIFSAAESQPKQGGDGGGSGGDDDPRSLAFSFSLAQPSSRVSALESVRRQRYLLDLAGIAELNVRHDVLPPRDGIHFSCGYLPMRPKGAFDAHPAPRSPHNLSAPITGYKGAPLVSDSVITSLRANRLGCRDPVNGAAVQWLYHMLLRMG